MPKVVLKDALSHIAECVQHARRNVGAHVKADARMHVKILVLMAVQGGAGQVVMENVQVLAIKLVLVQVKIQWIL